MDSLTQLTLGAACGEVVLGKKIGNRAMLWGAFGGILPDFDVLAYLFCDEMTALAFHRGFMHSILFSILAALGLGWAVERLYASGFYRRRGYKAAVMVFSMGLFALVAFGVNRLALLPGGRLNLPVLLVSLALGAGLGWLFWKKYFSSELQEVHASRRAWAWLFWLSIFTHPVLDSFTAYGTQLFQPFSNYRVAFNNISVVDPLYTVPFLLCLVAASFISRQKKARRVLVWAGIGISSAYMLFTLWHKFRMDRIFEQSLAAQGIVAQRYMTAPTILNNFLWQGVAEGDTAYYHGAYTFLGNEPLVADFTVVAKHHERIAPWEGDRTIRILRWFSGNYFNVIVRKDGRLQFNDLRYGSTEGNFDKESNYVFRFILEENGGKLTAKQTREGQDVSGEAFRRFFRRVLGK
jgi:inner membrane protein